MSSYAEKIRDFFKGCPLLKDGEINVNYLGENGKAYSIETAAATPVIKRYVDGGEIRQYVFMLASREYFDCDELENMDTARFYEELAEWIEKQNKEGSLPRLGEESLSLTAETLGYLYSVRGNTARFQIRCRLIYRK